MSFSRSTTEPTDGLNGELHTLERGVQNYALEGVSNYAGTPRIEVNAVHREEKTPLLSPAVGLGGSTAEQHIQGCFARAHRQKLRHKLRSAVSQFTELF